MVCISAKQTNKHIWWHVNDQDLSSDNWTEYMQIYNGMYKNSNNRGLNAVIDNEMFQVMLYL